LSFRFYLKLRSGIGLLLKVIKKDGEGMGFFSEISDDSARSTDSLLDGTIIINLGKTTPGTEVLTGLDHNNMHFTLSTKSADEFLVLLVFAVLRKTAKTGRTAVESLSAFVKSLLKSIMDKSLLEDLLFRTQKRVPKRNQILYSTAYMEVFIQKDIYLLTLFKASRTLISTSSSTSIGASAATSSPASDMVNSIRTTKLA